MISIYCVKVLFQESFLDIELDYREVNFECLLDWSYVIFVKFTVLIRDRGNGFVGMSLNLDAFKGVKVGFTSIKVR